MLWEKADGESMDEGAPPEWSPRLGILHGDVPQILEALLLGIHRFGERAFAESRAVQVTLLDSQSETCTW